MTASIGGSRSVGINSDDLQKLIKFVGTLDEKDNRKSQSAKMNAILEDAINRKVYSISSEDLEQGRRLYEQYQNQFNIDPNNSSLTAEEKKALDLLKTRKEEYDELVEKYQGKIKMSRTWTEKLVKWAKRQLFRRKSNKFSDIVNSEMPTTTIDIMSIDDMLKKIKDICKNSIVNMRTNINDRNALVKSGLLRDVEMVKMYLGKIEGLPDEMKQGHENEIADAKNQYSNLKDYYNAFINGERLPARDLLERYAKAIKKLFDEAKDEENLSKDALLKEMNEYKRLREKFLTKYVGLNIGEARRKAPEERKESEKYSEEEFKILDVLDGVRYALTNKKCYYDAWTILNNAFEFDQDRCLATVEDLFDHIDSRGWVEEKSIPEEFTKKHYVELLKQRREELFNLHPEIKRPKKDDSLDKIKQDASVIKNQLSSEISRNAKSIVTPGAHLASLMKKFKNLAGDDQSKYTPEQTEVFNLLSDIENSLHNRQLFFDNQSAIRAAFAKYNSDKDAGYDEIKKLAPMLEASAAKYLNASNYSADWCNKTLADIFEKEVAKYPELKQKIENGDPQQAQNSTHTSNHIKPDNINKLQMETIIAQRTAKMQEELNRAKKEAQEQSDLVSELRQKLKEKDEIIEQKDQLIAEQTSKAYLAEQKSKTSPESILEEYTNEATKIYENHCRAINHNIENIDSNIKLVENSIATYSNGKYYISSIKSDPQFAAYLDAIPDENLRNATLEEYAGQRARQVNKGLIESEQKKLNELKQQKEQLKEQLRKEKEEYENTLKNSLNYVQNKINNKIDNTRQIEQQAKLDNQAQLSDQQLMSDLVNSVRQDGNLYDISEIVNNQPIGIPNNLQSSRTR